MKNQRSFDVKQDRAFSSGISGIGSRLRIMDGRDRIRARSLLQTEIKSLLRCAQNRQARVTRVHRIVGTHLRRHYSDRANLQSDRAVY